MMRAQLTLLILLTRAVCAQDMSTPPPVQHPATVRIELESQEYVTGEQFIRKGTGFFISPFGYAVTCWHLIEPFGADKFGVRVPRFNRSISIIHGGKTWLARVAAFDPTNDLAILATQAKHTPFVPPKGFKLPAIGDALGRTPEHADIRIVRQLRTTAGSILLEANVPFTKGDSGGPLFHASGRLGGVAKSYTLGAARRGIVIPATAITDLLNKVDVQAPWQPRAAVTIESEPSGAVVFSGKQRLGTTPLKAELPSGLTHLRILRQQHAPWNRLAACRPGMKVTAELSKHATFNLATNAVHTPDNYPMPRAGKDILRVKLDTPDKPAWLERAGGAWKLHDGEIRLDATKPVLNRCTFGRDEWDNYAFAGEVRFGDGTADARAGLIFREGDNGFYCLRLLPKRGRVQLAWHNHSPFGWLILAERELSNIPARNWLELFVYKDRIACAVNGRPVAALRCDFSGTGKVGIYGSGCNASFTRLLVSDVREFAVPDSVTDRCNAFWFYERFSDNAATWRTGTDPNRIEPPPWLHTDAGAVVDATKQPRTAAAAEFILDEFNADLVYKMRKGAEGTIGFSFARHWSADGVFTAHEAVIDKKTDRISLSIRRGNRLEPLFAARLSPEKHALLFAAPLCRLILRARRNRILLTAMNQEFMAVELKTPLPRGRFGIITGGTQFLFEGLMLSSPDNADVQ